MADIHTPRAQPRRHNRLRAALLLGLLALVVVAAALLAYLRPHATGTRIGVGDVLTIAKQKRVVTATIRDEDALVVGEVRAGRGPVPDGGRFSAELPRKGGLNASVTALLAATGAHVEVDHQSGKDHARIVLTTLLPVLLLTDLLALVLLTSPYGVRLHAPHGHRGRHDLPAPPVEAQPADAVDLPPATSALDLPAVPVEAHPDDVVAPAKRATAARKAPPRTRTATKAVPAAPAEVQPVKRARKAAPRAAPRKAPAKAQRAEDVLPAPRPTRRRTQS